jgi:splicing factor 3B subunit 3
LDVPAAPGFLLLSRLGELLLLDLRRPSSPLLADICSFQKSLDEEEGSLNTVAASALLQLTRGQDGTSKKSLAPNMDLNFDPLSLPTITAWSWELYAEGQSRLALAMDTGEIHLARLSFKSSDAVPRIKIQQRQYKCSPCNLVLWTKGDLLAVFVEMGDGQVLRCSESGKVTCKSVIQNLAPILDFALADYHNEKQDQMFACSGAGSEGSLRVIRNGISVEKLHTTSPIYQVIISFTLCVLSMVAIVFKFIHNITETKRVARVVSIKNRDQVHSHYLGTHGRNTLIAIR